MKMSVADIIRKSSDTLISSINISYFRDDSYGPNNMTIYMSDKNNDGENGVFHVNKVKGSDSLNYMRARTPFRLFKADILSGRLKPVSKEEVIKKSEEVEDYA